MERKSVWFWGLFLSIILPFVFMFNPIMFIVVCMLFVWILIKDEKNLSNRTIVAILATTLFSGVSVLGFRLYDWVILIAVLCSAFRIISKPINTNSLMRITLFLIVVVANAFINFGGENVISEVLRYFISIALIILVLSFDDFSTENIENMHEKIQILCIANLILAFLTFFLSQDTLFKNYELGYLNTNLFLFSQEIRLFGFFSDPNKFMAFSACLLFMVEYYIAPSKKRNFTIALLLIAIIASLARTALVMVVAYVVLKLLKCIEKKSKGLSYTVIIVLALGIGLLYFSGIIDKLIEEAYALMAEILHRDRTAEINGSVSEDSRIVIWKEAIEFIKKKVIIGYGWLSNEVLLPYPTHNTVLALLLDSGIIGLVSFLFLFSPLLKIDRWDISVSMIIVPALFLDMQNYRLYFLLLALLMLTNNKSVSKQRLKNVR